MGPGDIVRLNPESWDDQYAGHLAMVVGLADYEMDEDYSDRLIIVADPIEPGTFISCWPEELLPWDASLELATL